LYVSPEPINAAKIFSDNWKGFFGPAVSISLHYGGTSGRYVVAEVIARVFPAYRPFVDAVMKSGVEPASPYPSGPYATDTLSYRSQTVVEYRTPALTDGLGTLSWLRKNGSPIEGVAMLLGDTPNLLHLAARLPPELAGLASAIVRQAALDAPQLARH
jgi:hypothetical protein